MSKMAEKTMDDGQTDKKSAGEAILEEVSFFTKLFAFLLVFYTFVFGHYKIPSESMQPTLEVGDHLYVSKFAYGYSRHSVPLGLHKLPFLPDGQIFSRLPKRGDVAVFRNPRTGIVMIKRIVGLPGDEVTMSRGRAYLNGDIITRRELSQFQYREDYGPRSFFDKVRGRKKYHEQWGDLIPSTSYSEQWPDEDVAHVIYEISDTGDLDNTRPFIVPEGHVFAMGDNRDRSLDSRATLGPGPVPLDHLIGRADRMMFSFKKCQKEEGIYCPPMRFFKKL